MSPVIRSYCSGVSRSSPAAACSRVDSGVRSPAIAALPARSGCARISASRAARGAALDDRDHRGVQRVDAAERARRPGPLGDPRRLLEHAAEARHERVAVQAVGCVDVDRRPIGAGYRSCARRERHRHRGLRDRHRRRRPARARGRPHRLRGRPDRRGRAPAPRPPCPDGARRIDGRGMLATPGLVNCHHHLYQHATRGYAQEATLFEWLVALYPVWQHIDDAVVAAAARAGLARSPARAARRRPTTTTSSPATPGDLLAVEIDAARAIGLRFHPCRGAMDLGRERRRAAARRRRRGPRRDPRRERRRDRPLPRSRRRARWCGSRSRRRRRSRSPAS